MWLLIICAGIVVLLLFFRFVKSSQEYVVADWGHRRLNFIDGSIRWFCRRYHRLDANISIPLPTSGPAIVVANHVSGLDPLTLVAIAPRPLRFLIAREQYRIPLLNWVYRAAGCIPVDRENRPEKALREAYEALAKGEVVALFPQGGIEWPVNVDHKVKGGAIRMAMKHQAPIYPVNISGVGLPGFTMLALPIRSHLKVEVCEPLVCSEEDKYQEYVNRLTKLIKK